MKWFIENCTPTNIGIALSLAVIALVLFKWINFVIDQGDKAWLERNPLSPDEQESIDRQCAEHYVSPTQRAADLRDLYRGTKAL